MTEKKEICNKERAKRNRTLSLENSEYPKYQKKLITQEDVKKQSQKYSISEIENKTINADLFSVIDLIPDGIADLIIIDPPYNLSKDFDGYKFKALKDDDYLSYLRTWFPKVVQKLNANGTLYLCGDWKCTSALQTVMEENLFVMNRITWQREKGRGAKENWKNSMEDIWFGVKDKDNYYFDVESVKMKRRVVAPYKVEGKPKDWEETPEGNFRLTYPSNFWDDISVPYWSMAENTEHPTQKPEKLIAKLILASCPKNGLVFDPFLGSGTTSVTAKKLGRRYLGIEMNTEYAMWAEKRLEMAESDKQIQGYTDGVFWERNTTAFQHKAKTTLRPTENNTRP